MDTSDDDDYVELEPAAPQRWIRTVNYCLDKNPDRDSEEESPTTKKIKALQESRKKKQQEIGQLKADMRKGEGAYEEARVSREMREAEMKMYGLVVTADMDDAEIDEQLARFEGGHRGILFDRVRGVLPQSVGEGTHFLIPWWQWVVMVDVRTRPRNISTTTGSKDMQMVSLTLRVLHRPNYDALTTIYQNLGLDYDERVLPSIGNEVLKAIVAQFDAGELITQRELVSQRIRDDLLKRAGEFNIILEDVSITHLTFGKEFTNAVEQKQIAQQEAERARFVVEKAEQEKQAAIIRAEGDAIAAELISKSLSKAGPGLVELRRIEAAKEIASTLSSSRNVTYLPSGGKGNSNILLHVNQ
ncbi:Prohibitin-1, subunit of the prohibitin complex (Phb1p-Phb2p) [Phlyctochytrium bullatum]|nr:Prohibitin-1, subunit of the prohibitin complex (Phb1p-Phb2p) [Phlyctochytrium bullatum]